MPTMGVNGVLKVIASSLFLLATTLGGVAWWLVSQYQLPFPSIIPIVTAILGPTDFFTTYRSIIGLQASRRGSKRPLSPFLLFANLLLLVLPAILVAYSTPYLGNNQCQLGETWHSWYSKHDAKAIKGLQDTLQCCGFKTKTDMAYPFHRNPTDDDPVGVPANTCAKILGLATARACGGLWEEEVKTGAGLVVGAGTVMLFLKLAFLMVVLGSPKLTQKWFIKPQYGGYDHIRAIEEVEDEEEEEEEEEPRARIPPPAEGRTGENGTSERTRLLLPQTHGINGRQVVTNDEEQWR